MLWLASSLWFACCCERHQLSSSQILFLKISAFNNAEEPYWAVIPLGLNIYLNSDFFFFLHLFLV